MASGGSNVQNLGPSTDVLEIFNSPNPEGVKIPRIGLGVFQASSNETEQAVKVALEEGYRHIDTAALYRNEGAVGRAVRASGIPREEIFVTTKLWNSDHGFQKTLQAFDRSLSQLGLEYVDLYLIHSPMPAQQRLESWRAMEAILASGKARSIGVSNYGIAHLEELFANCSIRPSVNQLGKKYQTTPAQVLIRWGLQKYFVVLPKSVTPARIASNARVYDFEISGEDMSRLDALNENFVTGWDPTTCP